MWKGVTESQFVCFTLISSLRFFQEDIIITAYSCDKQFIFLNIMTISSWVFSRKVLQIVTMCPFNTMIAFGTHDCEIVKLQKYGKVCYIHSPLLMLSLTTAHTTKAKKYRLTANDISSRSKYKFKFILWNHTFPNNKCICQNMKSQDRSSKYRLSAS